MTEQEAWESFSKGPLLTMERHMLTMSTKVLPTMRMHLDSSAGVVDEDARQKLRALSGALAAMLPMIESFNRQLAAIVGTEENPR